MTREGNVSTIWKSDAPADEAERDYLARTGQLREPTRADDAKLFPTIGDEHWRRAMVPQANAVSVAIRARVGLAPGESVRCPSCRKTLPGSTGEHAAPGDAIECGLCGHIWKLSAPVGTTLGGTSASLELATMAAATGDGAERADGAGNPLVGEVLPSAPFVAGSATSHAAAVRADTRSEDDRARILAAVRASGDAGMTCDALEVALGMLHQTASARVRGLVHDGLLRRTMRSRKTRTGCNADVLVATTPGAQTEMFA